MNGLKLAQEIRRLAPGLPIVISSGLSEGSVSADAGGVSLAALGVRAQLRKPYVEAELLAVLGHELGLGTGV